MKFFNIALIFVILAFACSITFAEESPKRGILLRRPNNKSEKTSTTAAPEEEELGDEEYDNHEQPQDEEQYNEEGASAASTTTTSTEPPKKIGPIIRPFRSNDDFLNSLKRRQMNAKKGSPLEKPTPKAHKATTAAPNDEDVDSDEPAPAAPATSKFKGNPALNRRKLTKPSKPEHDHEDADNAAAEDGKESSPVKRPGRLNLRTRN